MSDHKGRIKSAIDRYIQKQEKKPKAETRKNQAPEKEVEKECLEWMRNQGWVVDIYDSKAVWNNKAQRYISQNMKAGTADCMGAMPNGIAVVIEFKAPKKRHTFAKEENFRQQAFMRKMIKSGCFGVVVDSQILLYSIHRKWESLREKSIQSAQDYLLAILPRRSKTNEGKLFDD